MAERDSHEREEPEFTSSNKQTTFSRTSRRWQRAARQRAVRGALAKASASGSTPTRRCAYRPTGIRYVERNKLNLDILWLEDDSLEDID